MLENIELVNKRIDHGKQNHKIMKEMLLSMKNILSGDPIGAHGLELKQLEEMRENMMIDQLTKTEKRTNNHKRDATFIGQEDPEEEMIMIEMKMINLKDKLLIPKPANQ